MTHQDYLKIMAQFDHSSETDRRKTLEKLCKNAYSVAQSANLTASKPISIN